MRESPKLHPALELLVRRPWSGPLTVLFITVLMVAGLSRFERHPSAYLIEHDHPYRTAEHEINARFTGTGQRTLVVITPQTGTPLRPDVFQLMDRLSHAIEAMTLVRASDADWLQSLAVDQPTLAESIDPILVGGLDVSDRVALRDLIDKVARPHRQLIAQLSYRVQPVRRVRALTQVEDIRAEQDWLFAGPLVEPIPADAEAYGPLAERIRANPLYLGSLLSSDEQAVAIQVEYEIPGDQSPLMIEAHEALKKIVREHGAEASVSYAGTPVVMVEVGRAMKQDNEHLFPLVLVVIGIVLAFCLRSLGAVLLTLGIALLTVLWTVGFMSWVRVPLNVITNVMPVVLITISVAGAIHFISKVQLGLTSGTPEQAVRQALHHLFQPMFLASITTGFGFMTIALTYLDYVRHFGIFLTVGTLFALFITILVLPGLLQLFPRLAGQPRLERAMTSSALVSALVGRLLSFPRAYLVSVLLIGGGCAYIGLGIKPGFSNIHSFGADTELRRDHDRIGLHYDGMIPMELWVHTNTDRGLIEPDAMRFLAALEDRFRQHPGVGYVVGPTSFVKRIHQVLVPGAGYELPEPLTNAVVGQYLVLYEGGSGQEIRDFFDTNYRNARILALANTDEAKVWREIGDDVLLYAKRTAPPGVEIEASGHGWIARQIMVEIIRSQVFSLFAGILLITGMISLLFRSLIVGMIGAIPAALTLACNFAWMRLAGIPLDIGTAMIAAVTFGVGDDYSIHILAAIRASEGKDWRTRVSDAVGRVARPVMFNTLAVSGGFLVLMAASFGPIQHLGKFVAATLTFCAVVALLIVPILVERLRPPALSPASTGPTRVVPEQSPLVQDDR